MLNIAIAIVNYNTRDLLKRCLQNLADIEPVHQIIVVDNASSDGSAQMVCEHFPAVTLIQLAENRGLPYGYNLALNQTDSDYLLFLGSDAYPGQGVLSGMMQFMGEHLDVGIATAKLILRDGQLDMDAHRGFPTPWTSLTHFLGLGKLFPHSPRFNRYFMGYADLNRPHEIDLCISHFMLVRRSLFAKIGPWDEEYFLYGEDVDLCYRTKAAGFKVIYLPQFEVLHYKGASVGVRHQTQDVSLASRETKLRAAQLSTRAMALFYRKHLFDKYPWIVSATVMLAIRLLQLLRQLKIRLRN